MADAESERLRQIGAKEVAELQANFPDIPVSSGPDDSNPQPSAADMARITAKSQEIENRDFPPK